MKKPLSLRPEVRGPRSESKISDLTIASTRASDLGPKNLLPALKHQRGVRSPKPKGVGQHYVQRGFSWLIRYVVQVALRIGRGVIHRWRDHLVSQCQDADARFQTAGTAQQVAGHALGGTDRHFAGMLAEGPLDRNRFK